MRGRHRGGEPRLDVWLGRLWLLGTTAGLSLLALTVQHDGEHPQAAVPLSKPDTEPAPPA